jgi:hypothetical protein
MRQGLRERGLAERAVIWITDKSATAKMGVTDRA